MNQESMSNNTFTITELNQNIKNCIDKDLILQNIYLKAEVGSINQSGGHLYITLKDANSSIDAIVFRNRVNTNYLPIKGDKLLIYGSVTLYLKGGRISFQITSYQKQGEGDLIRQLQLLKERLTKEGYFDIKNKKEIPKYIKNLCVLTSKHGAVIHDINTALRKKNDVIDIYLYDVSVQGKNSANSITNAISIVDKQNYDLILIARGGGSSEDLMSFNDENLIKAVYNMKTPVVSAIGHESDISLIDLVADKYYGTPSIAAENIAFNSFLLYDQIEQFINNISKETERKHNNLKDKYSRLLKEISLNIRSKHNDIQYQISHLMKNIEYLVLSNIDNKLDKIKTLNIDDKHKINIKLANYTYKKRDFTKTIINKISNKYQIYSNRFNNVEILLKEINPSKILKKGYYLLKHDNNYIQKANNLKKGDILEVIGENIKMKTKIIERSNNE